VKKTEDGKGDGVIVMKKLTTRGLQALAGGPSRLRSVKGAPVATAAAASHEAPKMRAPVDSMAEVTLPRETAAPIALATDEELDQATLLLEQGAPQLRDSEIETLMQSNPMVSPRPAAGLAAQDDERVERTAVLQAPTPAPAPVFVAPEPAPAPQHQMSLRTPPTLIGAQLAIPDEIRQLAIKALEAQKTAAQFPSVGAVVLPPPASQPAMAKSAVTPVPQKPQPGAPAVVKSGGKVQIVVRETKRRTAFGWTAMLLALGVFVGLSTVAVVHGDAKHAWDAAKSYASQKRAEPAPAVAAAPPAAPTPDPVAVAPVAPPAPADPVAAPAPTPDPKADTRIADNKPATDPKDDAKAAPKPDPKPEVMKPDPAPRPQQKPSNAYASTKVASNDDKPAPKVAKADAPPPMFAAPKPEPKAKPDAVAAKPKPEKEPVATAKPDPKPAAAAPKDDDVAKISQMAQQQLGAALP